ncbi:MAG TPA: hypothetical protein PLX10_00085 [Candidatus Paceibacterota bacterium]|nr:hypothetical protein [Candidatus Paceibacterota bacterium]
MITLAIWKLLNGLAWHNTYFLFFIAFLSLALSLIANKTTGLVILVVLYLAFLGQLNKKDYPPFTYQVRLKIFFWFLTFTWFFWIYSLSQYLPFGLSLILLISGFRLLLQIANNETACLGDNLLQDLVYLFAITQFAWLAVLLPLNPFGQAFFLMLWSLYFNERFKDGLPKQSLKDIILQTVIIVIISIGALLLK